MLLKGMSYVLAESFTASDGDKVTRKSTNKWTTGRDLRSRISAELGIPAGSMRVLLVEAPGVQGNDTSAAQCGTPIPVCNSAPLALWKLDAEGACVKVFRKQRGGKKPGKGWHKLKSGRTCTMSIAGSIVRDTVFSRAEQFYTVAGESWVLTLLRLCDVLQQDALVLCSAGSTVLRRELLTLGWSIADTGCARKGQRKLFLACEEDDPMAANDASEEDRPAPPPVAAGGAPPKDVLPTPAMLPLPAGSSDAGLVVVIHGHLLRETASLAKAVCALREPGQPALPVLHLVASQTELLLETEELRASVASKLSSGQLMKAVEVPGQPRAPESATLLSEDLPAVGEVALFGLRAPALGLVMRLRDRFGCVVPEMPRSLLEALLGTEERGQ